SAHMQRPPLGPARPLQPPRPRRLGQQRSPPMDQEQTLDVTVALENQQAEVRLDAQSPWQVVLVLAVLAVFREGWGFGYDIRYQWNRKEYMRFFVDGSQDIRRWLGQDRP
ncbi:unnamed protein product, partial [Mycena citricolor]